mmetsp:Transcript_6606/g.19623  ORF Transcript_6606/g.19623 Transcript_6606/m.19623 type:complete len:391 (-) Transcript_6606:166-1338(-)
MTRDSGLTAVQAPRAAWWWYRAALHQIAEDRRLVDLLDDCRGPPLVRTQQLEIGLCVVHTIVRDCECCVREEVRHERIGHSHRGRGVLDCRLGVHRGAQVAGLECSGTSDVRPSGSGHGHVPVAVRLVGKCTRLVAQIAGDVPGELAELREVNVLGRRLHDLVGVRNGDAVAGRGRDEAAIPGHVGDCLWRPAKVLPRGGLEGQVRHSERDGRPGFKAFAAKTSPVRGVKGIPCGRALDGLEVALEALTFLGRGVRGRILVAADFHVGTDHGSHFEGFGLLLLCDGLIEDVLLPGSLRPDLATDEEPAVAHVSSFVSTRKDLLHVAGLSHERLGLDHPTIVEGVIRRYGTRGSRCHVLREHIRRHGVSLSILGGTRLFYNEATRPSHGRA